MLHASHLPYFGKQSVKADRGDICRWQWALRFLLMVKIYNRVFSMASTESFSGRNSRRLVVEDSVGAVLGGNICGTERQTVSRHLCADRSGHASHHVRTRLRFDIDRKLCCRSNSIGTPMRQSGMRRRQNSGGALIWVRGAELLPTLATSSLHTQFLRAVGGKRVEQQSDTMLYSCFIIILKTFADTTYSRTTLMENTNIFLFNVL